MSFSSEIITLIDELAARFGIVIDWTAENIMPYLIDLGTRFVTFMTWRSVLGIVLMVSMLLFSIFILRKGIKMSIAGKNEDICVTILSIGVIATIFCIILNLVVVPSFINQILECKFLPEKIILDYLKGILAH